MLDELQEYRQYTFDYAENLKKEDCRIKYSTFIKHDFSGLARIMTVVARQFIFQNEDEPQNFNEEKVRGRLKDWFTNWLPGYIRHAFLLNYLKELRSLLKDESLLSLIERIGSESETNALLDAKNELDAVLKNNDFSKDEKLLFSQISNLIDALKNLRDMKSAFANKIFAIEDRGEVLGKKKNDYHKITYDRIIANALEQGRLHRYYLVCKSKEVPFDSVRKFTGKIKEGKKLSDSDKDMILKFTVAYLLEQKAYSPGYAPKYMAISKMDLANWMKKKDKPSNFELEKYKFVESGKRESLFDTRMAGNKGNVSKTYINSDWVEKFYLVDENDIDKPEHCGRILFSDAIGEMLCNREGKRYE